MSFPNDRGSSTPLLALLMLLALLVSYTAASPAIEVLRELRELDHRLQRSLALLQAAGRLASMGYGELQRQPRFVLPGEPPVRLRLRREDEGSLRAALFVEGEEMAALELYLILSDGRER